MQVHQILKSKGGGSAVVVTLAPGSSVADAAKLLSEKRIGAVIVSREGQQPSGIISERDIVREMGRRGADVLKESVDTLMTRELKTCVPTDSAEKVLTAMTEGRFRHMPVMQDGAMVGLISIGDVVKARLSELAMERDALESMVMGH